MIKLLAFLLACFWRLYDIAARAGEWIILIDPFWILRHAMQLAPLALLVNAPLLMSAVFGLDDSPPEPVSGDPNPFLLLSQIIAANAAAGAWILLLDQIVIAGCIAFFVLRLALRVFSTSPRAT